MSNMGWNWADLNRQQLQMLLEGEHTLGADILLAYKQSGASIVQSDTFSQNHLKAAPLNESQLECLQGLEDKLQATVVAYRHT